MTITTRSPSSSGRSPWPRRAIALVSTVVVGWLGTYWLGMRPSVVLLAAVTAASFALAWAVTDLHASVAAIEWRPPHRARTPWLRVDPRFSRLSRSFTDGTDPDVVARQVHASLTQVIDDRLLRRYGVDRTQDPEAAREVLGPQLARYVEAPAGATLAFTSRNAADELSELLTRIEAL